MQTFINITNTVTVGNLLTIGTILSVAIGVYWMLRSKWADAEYAYKRHIEDLTTNQTGLIKEITDNQTKTIEECIHKLPSHPES